jgi:tRNA threonylcarbamoyladenosine biosynthesis protein TsaE
MISHSAEETRAFAAQIGPRLLAHMENRTNALVVALEGELGAGKTTFTQALALALGVKQTPKSPTFMLVKEYLIPNTLYSLWHLDCYRLNNSSDLAAMDMASVFASPHNLVLIEWAERVADALPADRVTIRLEHQGADTRSITITGLLHA